MKQDQNNPKECQVCHQQFDSENELRQHEKSAHSQNKQQAPPASERGPKVEPGKENVA
jgi:hypothetical protein